MYKAKDAICSEINTKHSMQSEHHVEREREREREREIFFSVLPNRAWPKVLISWIPQNESLIQKYTLAGKGSCPLPVYYFLTCGLIFDLMPFGLLRSIILTPYIWWESHFLFTSFWFTHFFIYGHFFRNAASSSNKVWVYVCGCWQVLFMCK